MKVSICKNYDYTKGKDENHHRVAYGWSLKEIPWTEDEIVKLTTKNAVSGNEFKSGHKVNTDWMKTHCLMLDFDGGPYTLDWLLKEQHQWQFNSYVFSSQNHQKIKVTDSGKSLPACDRLRALIPLESPIKTIFDLRAVDKVFTQKYNQDGFDRTAFQEARYFAHGTTVVSSFIDGKGSLDWTALPCLYESHRPVKKPGRPKVSENEYFSFRFSDVVGDAEDQDISIKDLKPKSPIYCPVCGHSKYRSNTGHNAVLMINQDTELPFIFCSSCKSRGLGAGGEGVYNLHKDDAYRLKSEKLNATVFIDTLTSRYLGGCFEKGLDDFVVRPLTSIDHVKQFCHYHDLPIPEYFPRARYDLVFNSDETFAYDDGFVNKYIAPKVLRTPIPAGHKANLPKNIGQVIDHVLAHDDEIKNQFYNDLAWFVQNRKKLITTYLFQGVEGTGKGFLFNHILQPIFGALYCTQTDQDAFGNQFNGFLQDNVLVLVNEVSGNFSRSEQQSLSTIEKMKIAITDENIQIEGKNRDRINGRNCCSFLFATNRPHGVVLSESDRRFNVAPMQKVKIHDTSWWPGYDQLVRLVNSELQELIWYLKQHEVEVTKIGKVVDNEPKRLLQVMSQSNADQFFAAVKDGDVTWLREHLPEDDEAKYCSSSILSRFNGKVKVRVSELCALYNALGNKRLSTIAFGKLAAGYLGESTLYSDRGQKLRGWEIEWEQSKSIFE